MKAGKLDKYVELQVVLERKDNSGGLIRDWQTQFIRAASIMPLMGNKRFLAQQEFAELTHEITVRYDEYTATITPKFRVKFGNRFFKIHSGMNPDEKNERLILRCVEEL